MVTMMTRLRTLILAGFSTSLLLGAFGCSVPGFEGTELSGREVDESQNGTDVDMDGDEGDNDAPAADEPSALHSARAAVATKATCPTDARLSQGFSGKHDGVDLANTRGTPIFAVADGTVAASGPASGYGQWIRIKHDDGSMTEYGHMFQRDVQVGARVTAGQRIALMGSEGKSTGPHLHLRTYANANKTGSGSGMNPAEYMRARGVTLPCKPGKPGATTPPPPAGSFTVSAWKGAQVRDSGSLTADAISSVTANTTYVATCWKTGDEVQSDGYTNDRWVKLTADNDVEGFVSGIFLRGDETGGVTTECR
jgi:hypothetical protein